MKWVAAVVMLALAATAFLLPEPNQAQHGENPATEPPPVAICPIVATANRATSVSVLSSVNGEGRLSTFSTGEESGALEFRTGDSGAITIQATDAGAAGISGGLIEMPSDITAAAVALTGQGVMAAESCVDIPAGEAFLAGGSTASGAMFEVQLMNPYAGEAVLDFTVTTDAGIESDDRFDSVVVPALSSYTLDMNQIIPGRQEISVNIEVTSGSALVVGRQTLNGRVAMWRAVPAAQEWWLPIPAGEGPKELLLATPTNSEIEYQIDHFSNTGGLLESYASGVLPPRGVLRLALSDVTLETAAVRVVATGPLVPTLWIDSPTGLALTTASPLDAPLWLLPGAQAPAGGTGTVVILNTGLEEISVDVRSLQETALTRSVVLPAGAVAEVDLVAADGYRIEASGPVVALWSSSLAGQGSVAMGIPVQDG
ncbi:MAG TPA: DUF5719 family protein [Acidimicrobiia bacterium]|nr:DUF5719 family protein [Acidimicrobiia bacterium]